MSTKREWVEVKVDMRNEQVIIRKTVQHINDANQSSVEVFCLTGTGHWVTWSEGEARPEACLLPIYAYREFERGDLE